MKSYARKTLLRVKPGTLFKWVIRPYVLFSDKFMGTSLATCTRCKAREIRWNGKWERLVKKILPIPSEDKRLLD